MIFPAKYIYRFNLVIGFKDILGTFTKIIDLNGLTKYILKVNFFWTGVCLSTPLPFYLKMSFRI